MKIIEILSGGARGPKGESGTVRDLIETAENNFNFLIGSVFYKFEPSNSEEYNIINLPTTNNKFYNIKFIIKQGDNAYLPSVFKINNETTQISWDSSYINVGSPNKYDVINLNVNRINDNWVILGSFVVFG
jgi:hypothetical protein